MYKKQYFGKYATDLWHTDHIEELILSQNRSIQDRK